MRKKTISLTVDKLHQLLMIPSTTKITWGLEYTKSNIKGPLLDDDFEIVGGPAKDLVAMGDWATANFTPCFA